MTCTDCPVFKICPEKPVREDYEDENKYLIDLECGVWSCQKTIKKLYKENEQLKQQNEQLKQDFEKFKNDKVCDTCKYNTVGQDEYISVLEEQYRDCVKQLNEVYNCHLCGCNGCEKECLVKQSEFINE